MRVEKAAVFWDKIFNLIFLLCFSVIRWNFGIFLVLLNGGVFSDHRVGYILNKSENATPELFAIYMQNESSQ